MLTKRQQSVKRRRRPASPLGAHLPVDAKRLCLAIGTIAALTALMSVHFLPDKVSLTIGDRSPSEIRATRSVSYVDSLATARQRAYAAARAGIVYHRDNAAVADAAHTVTDIFDKLRRARSDGSLTPARRLARLSGDLGAVFGKAQLEELVAAAPETIDRLQAASRRLVESTMDGEIREGTSDQDVAVHGFAVLAARAATGPSELAILKAVGARAIRQNMLVDQASTYRAHQKAERTAPVVVGQIRPGDVIVRQGEVFTQLHLDMCAALGLVNPRIDLNTVFSLLVLATALVMVIGGFARSARPNLYAQPRLLFLLSAIIVCSVLGLKVFGNLLGIPISGVQFGYLGVTMVLAAGMLIAVLLDTSLAVLVTALLAVLTGLILNHEIRFAVMALFTGLVGIYCVSTVVDRSHMLRAALAVGSVNLVLAWALAGLLGDTLQEIITGSAWALISSAFAVPIFWFGVAVLEKPFGILTHVWLLELSASEQPLLRELCMQAPGTYAHSIMVGNLAEAAAEAVGANSLFCRVASYYHDVGKIRRADCFVENQRGVNIHDRLNPSLSALIIASHVRDGQALADEYRLPRQIRAVVAEHHGTSLIRYFYHQALFESGSTERDPVLEQHFRYEGPRPQTRESGIIMLADTVEAAARCLTKPSAAHIQSLVETLVQNKLTDGQLDECDLTLKDLRKIETQFVRVLSAMLHSRVDYPDMQRGAGEDVAVTTEQAGLVHAAVSAEPVRSQGEDEAVAPGGADDPHL